MSGYNYSDAPAWNSNAVTDEKGWVDSVTGEVLVAINNLSGKVTDIGVVPTFAAVLSGGHATITVTTTTPGVLNTTSEVQTIVLNNATGGTFTITFDGQTTAAIAYNASTATVQAALWALSNVADNDVAVTGSAGNYTLTWINSLGDVAQPTCNVGSLQGGVTYVTGDILTVTVTATEAVVVDGRPTIAVTINAANRVATYDGSASTGTSLVFKYTIVAGDVATAGQVTLGTSMHTATSNIGDALPNGGSRPLTSGQKVFPAVTTTAVTVN